MDCPCGCGKQMPGKQEGRGPMVPSPVGVAVRLLEGYVRDKECRRFFPDDNRSGVEMVEGEKLTQGEEGLKRACLETLRLYVSGEMSFEEKEAMQPIIVVQQVGGGMPDMEALMNEVRRTREEEEKQGGEEGMGNACPV